MERIEHYDVIILGTGFSECLLGGLLSKEGRKVLLLDRERFSGGANGSISCFEELEEKMEKKLDLREQGEWNVDLAPMFFTGRDRMTKLLEYIGVKLNTKPIQSIFMKKGADLVKVPTSMQQVDCCSMIPKSDRVEFKRFIQFAKNWNASKPCTKPDDVNTLLGRYKLSPDSKLLIKHGILCVKNPDTTSCDLCLDKVKRFCDVPHFQASSVQYPIFGLGEIIQGLLKQISTRGGRCMLNRPIYDLKREDGMMKVTGRGITAMGYILIGDPSYLSHLVRPVGKVVRALCVLDHPVADTSNAQSCLITLPGPQIGKAYDIYVSTLGESHSVAPRGLRIAHVSTTAETDEPEQEIQAGLEIIGKTRAVLVTVQELCRPMDDTADCKVFVTSSYDSSMDWESVYDDVRSIYERMTSKNFPI